MKTVRQWKAGFLIMATALICTTSLAQPRHFRPHHPVAVVSITPSPAPRPVSGYTQKERLALAVSYLKKHKYLTVKRYAKMTKLSKVAAEIELDSFSKSTPIRPVIRKGKKVYAMG